MVFRKYISFILQDIEKCQVFIQYAQSYKYSFCSHFLVYFNIELRNDTEWLNYMYVFFNEMYDFRYLLKQNDKIFILIQGVTFASLRTGVVAQ